jgi:hypothetical protein
MPAEPATAGRTVVRQTYRDIKLVVYATFLIKIKCSAEGEKNFCHEKQNRFF